MIKELGEYQPFGKKFLSERPHLLDDISVNPVLDFSKLYIDTKPKSAYKLFSISDTLKINVGDRLDERYPIQHGSTDNPIIGSEQEVYFEGTIVVWTRAGCVLKTFNYSDENETVQQVLFAWFPVSSDSDPTSKASDMDLNDLGDDTYSERPLLYFNSAMEDDEEKIEEIPQKKKTRPLEEDEPDQSNLLQRRALCIVFQKFIKIHYEDGAFFTAHAPFEIGEVIPLDKGVVVSRKYEADSKRKNTLKLASIIDSDSNFMTVTHPLKGHCPVKSKEITYSHKLLFATTKSSDAGRLPVLVTFSLKDYRHYIWTYERRKDINDSRLSNPQASNKRKTNTLLAKRRLSKNHLPTSKKKAKLPHSPQRPHPQFHEDYISDDEIVHENELEKELYHELLDPSEISLRLLWKETINSKSIAKMRLMKHDTSDAFLLHDLNGEELIGIMNPTLKQLDVINLTKATSNAKKCIDLTVTAQSAIPIYASRDAFADLLYIDARGDLQHLISPSMPARKMTLSSGRAVKLIDPIYDRFTAVHQNGEAIRFQINLRPKTSLVRDCFAAIGCADNSILPAVWHKYIDHKFLKHAEWDAFFISFLSLVRLKRRSMRHYYLRDGPSLTSKEIQIQQVQAANKKYAMKEFGILDVQISEFLMDKTYREGVDASWIDEILAEPEKPMDISVFSDIVQSLHVVYEDYRIKITTSDQANLLGYLLMQCAVILDNHDWIEYYKGFGINPNFVANLQSAEKNFGNSLVRPPNIQVCLRQMTPNTSSIVTLLSYFGVNTLDSSPGFCNNTYAETIDHLWSLYGAIHSGDKSLLLERMVEKHITRRDIEILVENISLPILNILDEYKLHPEVNWTKQAYYIIGRNDIYKQLQMDVSICDPNANLFNPPFQKDRNVPKSMSELSKECSTTYVDKYIFKNDVLNMETERLRFGFCGVIEKVRIMLDSTKVPEHHVPNTRDLTDDDLAVEHQYQVQLLLSRTLSLPVGRAIYAFGTHMPDYTKALPIEPFNLSAKILPLRTIVNIDESMISDEMLNWPNFHNGVAAGLRISPTNHINQTWVDSCFPETLETQHGGALLAMGLNGILKRMPLLSYFRYISHYAEYALIGFILGASVTYRGTMEPKIMKVLSVYISDVLFAESACFFTSNLMRMTALLGVGLNFMESCDRAMSANMLKELGKNAYTDPSELEPNHEGCSLAAGFSLGLITLGAGDKVLDDIDRDLPNELFNFMIGQRAKGSEGRSANLDITSPSATVALALMYLKTENAKVANAIEIPQTAPYLNYVRPDFLLLRVVAKSLIMWSSIEPTKQWIKRQIPEFLKSNAHHPTEPSIEDNYQNLHVTDEVFKQAKYYIICGACQSMGLRFAGSKNENAFKVLLDYLDYFMRLQLLQDTNSQQRIIKYTVRTCVDVICTAAAMVMAGTGNRELISRLEQLNSRVSAEMNYGNHMAVSMSLGLLFVGLGGYTLTTTNESIASLLCAFYPFYPTTPEDNQYHCQAFRHLWVIAVDSRWLMPFDVVDKKPCRAPMYLELYEDDGGKEPVSQRKVRQVRIEAPTVVPDYELVKSIQLDSERYWSLSVDMTKRDKYQTSIIKSGVIYVEKKENKMSYEDDPTGLYSFY